MKQAIIDLLGKPFWETLPELFVIAGCIVGAICAIALVDQLLNPEA